MHQQCFTNLSGDQMSHQGKCVQVVEQIRLWDISQYCVMKNLIHTIKTCLETLDLSERANLLAVPLHALLLAIFVAFWAICYIFVSFFFIKQRFDELIGALLVYGLSCTFSGYETSFICASRIPKVKILVNKASFGSWFQYFDVWVKPLEFRGIIGLLSQLWS